MRNRKYPVRILVTVLLVSGVAIAGRRTACFGETRR